MPVYSVHITNDLQLDLQALYQSRGESADEIRDALVEGIRKLKHGEWDNSRFKIHGFSGTTFSLDFCSDYIVTFTIDTYRNEMKQPIEEHYYLKNLLRKK